MANLFDDAFEALGDEMRDAAGILVTYSRSSDEVEVTAVRGQTSHRSMIANGLQVNARFDDFHIKRSDLILSAVAILPKENDKIVVTAGGKVRTFAVTAPEGLNCYSLVDADTCFRIHTVNIRTESV